MIFLFTDFGGADIYVGQLKAVLGQVAPGVPVIDLLNDAPRFNIELSAHLLAALAAQLPAGSVTLAVVDPGVGTERKPVVLRCAQRWFVGPDNGLLSVLAAGHAGREVWEIAWRPEQLSRTFHGRDLFAPVAGRIAAYELGADELRRVSGLRVELAGGDLAQIIYIDSYGNAISGIHGRAVDQRTSVTVAGEPVGHADVFAAAERERPFWYVNSLGLIEIACNQASAAAKLGLRIGDPVGLTAA